MRIYLWKLMVAGLCISAMVIGSSLGARTIPLYGEETMTVWKAFELGELETRREQSGRPYLEFLRTPTLTTGLYFLPAGGTDRQSPHELDEVYYIIEGRATLRVNGEDRPVRPGSVVYVQRGIEHRFHSITEDLEVLVFFSTAKREGE